MTEWIIRFIKNRDLILKRIISIDEKKEEDIIIANLEDNKKHIYLIVPFLDESDIKETLKKLKGYDFATLVVYNTKENKEFLINNWDKLAKFNKGFSIHFVNPFSKTNKRWSIYPATHEFIAGKKNLKKGISSISSNVEEIAKKEIEDIYKKFITPKKE